MDAMVLNESFFSFLNIGLINLTIQRYVFQLKATKLHVKCCYLLYLIINIME